LEGALIYHAECGIPAEVKVRLDFPFNYPQGEPHAFDAAGRFQHTEDRHFSTHDGCCCLWLPPKSRWDSMNSDALVPFLDEVVVFFDRQLVFDAGGQVSWPGGEYGHRGNGYREWLREELGSEKLITLLLPVLKGAQKVGRNDLCLCGSQLKFKRCHESNIDKIKRHITVELLKRLFP